jgi:hypothetical protein
VRTTINLLQPQFFSVRNNPSAAGPLISAYDCARTAGLTIVAIRPFDARFGSLDDYHCDSIRLQTFERTLRTFACPSVAGRRVRVSADRVVTAVIRDVCVQLPLS